MGTYGDIELLLTDWLASQLSVRTCTELPATLTGDIVQVVRFGGTRPNIPFDLAHVDVDAFSATRASSRNLAERVCTALMYSLPGYSASGVRFLSAEPISAPSWAPYDNTSVRRSTAAYLIRTHNPI